MIAFLHTSAVHIQGFEKLVRKYNDTVEIKHFVEEDLLKTALETGALAKDKFVRIVQNIQATQRPNLLVCTCSTYGQLCEELEQIHRIDQPIANHIVANYAKIGIAYTVISTKEISQQLIQETAISQGKGIQLTLMDCSHCWPYFEGGNMDKYEKSIAQHLRKISRDVAVIFLAQASMEGAKKYLTAIKPIVVSSPEFGVRNFLTELSKKGK